MKIYDYSRIDLLIGLFFALIIVLLLDRVGAFSKARAYILPLSEHAAQVDLINTMYTNSPLAWIAVDGKGCVILWSPVAEEKFGYTALEAMGKKLEDLIIPDELKEAHRKGIERFSSTGVSKIVGNKFGFETEGKTKAGERISLRIVLTDMSANGKRKIGAYIYNRSHEVEREKENKHKIHMLECSEEVSGVGGWDWYLSSDNNEVAVTKNFRKIFGLDEDEVVTAPSLVSKIFPGDREEVVRTMDKGFQDQKDYTVSYRIERNMQWVHCIGIIVPGENRPERIYGTIQEIDG